MMRIDLLMKRVLLSLISAMGFGVFGCAADSSSGSAKSTSPLLSNEQDDDKDGKVDESDEADDDKDEDGEVDEDEHGADKVTCAADADCDPDETCQAGLCTGKDGEADDEADDDKDDDEADDDKGADDDKDDGEADDEQGADKITCSVNTDCDADETCVNGMCK